MEKLIKDKKYYVVAFLVMMVLGAFAWMKRADQQNFQQLLAEDLVLVEEEAEEGESKEDVEVEDIYVDIKGAVNQPGVYQMAADSRLFDLLAEAGGLRDDAAVDAINQAMILQDQMVLYIYTLDEWEDQATDQPTTPFMVENFDNYHQGQAAEDDSVVNINMADATKLQTLPGIGPKKAEAIIAYREDHGSFAAPEDIMDVSGIGVKTYEALAEMITVGP